MTKTNNKKTYKQLWAAKNFLLTCPNVTEPRPLEEYIEVLEKHPMYPQLTGAIIAKELHANGVPHFHAVLAFQKKKAIYKNDAFNFIFDKQLNIQPVRDLKASITYVTKSGDFKATGMPITPPTKVKSKKVDHRAEIYNFLNKEDRLLTDLKDLSDPNKDAVIYADAIKIDRWYNRTQTWFRHTALFGRPRIDHFDLDVIKGAPEHLKPYAKAIKPILVFLNKELNPLNRRDKSPNLLLWSSLPNTGKSSLLKVIENSTPAFRWPFDSWYFGWIDCLHQAILWDEFTIVGQKIDFLKLLFDGHALTLPIKGGQARKTDNPVILCASNHNLKRMFRQKYRYTCECNAYRRNDSVLCDRGNPRIWSGTACNTEQSTMDAFAAIHARIHSIELKAPIFPPGDNDLEWTEWRDLLRKAIVPAPSLDQLKANPDVTAPADPSPQKNKD